MKSQTVTCYGQAYKVRVVKRHKHLKKNVGHCDLDNNIIYILSTLPEDQQLSTLLHEIIHIVERCAGFNFTEEEVLRLESGLFQIIHDNKLRF